MLRSAKKCFVNILFFWLLTKCLREPNLETPVLENTYFFFSEQLGTKFQPQTKATADSITSFSVARRAICVAQWGRVATGGSETRATRSDSTDSDTTSTASTAQVTTGQSPAHGCRRLWRNNACRSGVWRGRVFQGRQSPLPSQLDALRAASLGPKRVRPRRIQHIQLQRTRVRFVLSAMVCLEKRVFGLLVATSWCESKGGEKVVNKVFFFF